MVRRQSFELDPESHPLAPAIIAFNRGNGWYRAVLGRPDQGGWIGLSELSADGADIDRRMTQLESAYGGHAGYAAASLIQQVAHPLVSLTAWCLLLGAGIPDISPSSVLLRQHPQGLFDRVAISGDVATATNEDESAATTGAVIVGSLSSLIESIRVTRKVGLAGLWHGVSDLIARTFIGTASALGSLETGVFAAEAILNRAPEVIRMTPRWHIDRATGMWFSLRSVCCLAYTGTSGLYCDTCPLLDGDEISRRLASNQAGAL
jgi:hypothetical protein